MEELIRGLPACPRRRIEGDGRTLLDRFREWGEERESGEPIRWGRPPDLGGGPAEGGRPTRRDGGEFSEWGEETPELSCGNHRREAYIFGELPVSCPEGSVAGGGANQLHHAAEAPGGDVDP